MSPELEKVIRIWAVSPYTDENGNHRGTINNWLAYVRECLKEIDRLRGKQTQVLGTLEDESQGYLEMVNSGDASLAEVTPRLKEVDARIKRVRKIFEG